MNPIAYCPIRNLRDVEALEQIPLEGRVDSWNLNHWIRRGAMLAPAKAALIYLPHADLGEAPQVVTYDALRRGANRAANLFHALGVRERDAVVTVLPTVPQLFTASVASIARGVACPVNWMLDPAHLADLVRAAGAKVVIALGPTPGFDIWEKVAAMRAKLPNDVQVLSVPGPDGKHLPDSDFETLASAMPDECVFSDARTADDLCAYIHSGGTTGAPKLVQLTHRGFVYKTWSAAAVSGNVAADVTFADYPLFHVAGFVNRLVTAIAHGMTVVIPSPIGARDRRFVDHYWRFVERFGVTLFTGVPTTLSLLAKLPLDGADVRSLKRHATTGSQPMPVEIPKQLEAKLGVRVGLTYGATEFCTGLTQPPRDGDPRLGSTGIRLPYAAVKAVKLGPAGAVERDCGIDEIGVVIGTSPGRTPGYADAGDNAGLFTADGWIITGDLGRVDDEGYLWITGRVKDLIIRGGHNIDPSLIEEVLARHPAVLHAAAVGKPDAYAGELPVGYVQLAPGAAASADAIKEFARLHIAERAAAPSEIFIVAAMPLTDVHKPAKVALRNDAARRAFQRLLDEIAPPDATIVVSVAPDEARGTLATIAVNASVAARAHLQAKIDSVMKGFSIPYVIAHRD